MSDVIDDEYGQASLTPTTDVVVGTYRSWDITFTVGDLGMDDGSTLKIASNMTSDWGVPQFTAPSSDNYATVETSGSATVEASYDPEGYVRPFKNTVTIDVFDGSLDKGDTITLILGDRSRGSMGHRAQTYPENDFRIGVLVDAFGTGEFVELPEDLTFDVVPGTAESVVAIVPSTAAPDEPVTVSLRVEDLWGNTASHFDGKFSISSSDLGLKETVEVTEGIGQTAITIETTGSHRFEISADDTELTTFTNPITVANDNNGIYWGDIHGQSGETVGTGTIWEYLEYARDNAFVDFASHAGNDFQITDDFWDEIQEAINTFNEPDNFITFLCYEWSANTSRGGDHNVYFKGDEGEIHRSSSWQIAENQSKHTGTHPITELYEHYEGRDDVLIIPHQGGRPATLDVFDSELSPFVEIVSVWGVFEWFGQETLQRDYPVGFVGGSDDHTCRPGATSPTNQTQFNIDGGLMAVHASELTRDRLWEAFNQRRCYATTGARIFLKTEIEGARMGEKIAIDSNPEMAVTAEGTAPLRRIELFRGSNLVASQIFDDGDNAVEFTWSGARSKTRNKVQDWSGGLSIDQGRIASIEEFGFDHPEQGVSQQSTTDIRWTGATSGNYQGVRVQFDAPPGTTVSFATQPVSENFILENIESKTIIEAGHLDQQLEVRRVGDSSTMGTQTILTDQKVDEGRYSYYVRVTQSDGEMAWSSPTFVDVS